MKMQFALMSQTFDVYVVFCVRLEWNSIFLRMKLNLEFC